MTRRVLNCGYVPLVDCAPLILAKELGFAEDEGVTLNLLRQPSWSALRDLLALGHLDAAHMLAPMPFVMSTGLSGPKSQIDVPIVLSANGTVLGVSRELAKRMRYKGWQADFRDPSAFATALFHVPFERLRVGVPFPFSMHRLLFEYLIAGFSDTDRSRIEIITTPPPLMADAVAEGHIDVFCVGEPWGTVAALSGAAELALPGTAIWAHAPEKVLGLRRGWIADNDDTSAALVRAVYRAAEWVGSAENRPLASEILARSEHLDLSDHVIDPALTGQIVPRAGNAPWTIDGFLKFHDGATTFPWRSLGAWIGHQISGLHRLDQSVSEETGAACFRPDLYRRYLGTSHVDMPGASAKVEGAMAHRTAVASARGAMLLGPDAFFDGKTFEFSAAE